MRVLVAEEDRGATEILVVTLVHSGHQVTVAADGRKACRLAKTGQFRPVVCDWQMLEMTGIDLCRRLRQRQGDRYIYVILVSEDTDVERAVLGLPAGADDFLVEPFDVAEVRLRLQTGERVLANGGAEGRHVAPCGAAGAALTAPVTNLAPATPLAPPEVPSRLVAGPVERRERGMVYCRSCGS